jgi:ParB family chromosome partitioning protein
VARTVGCVEPVTARPLPGAPPPRYEILAGLQHWLLAQRAQLATVPIHLLTCPSNEDARRLVELDAGQAPPDPLAEARAIQAEVARGRSIAAVGRERGLSRTEASHRLRRLRLAPSLQQQVTTGALTIGKARTLVGLPEHAQFDLARRIAQEVLTTHQVESLAKAGKPGSSHLQAGAGIAPEPPAKDPDLARLEVDLAERLGTRVTVTYGANGRGRLIVEFADLEILEGVVGAEGVSALSSQWSALHVASRMLRGQPGTSAKIDYCQYENIRRRIFCHLSFTNQ